MINIEKEFNVCVSKVGGYKISDLVGKNPKFLNADYWFPNYEVIAELKCLDDDQIKSENIRRKATEIYNRYMEKGAVRRLPKGTTKLTGNDLPEELKHELIELYRSSVHTTLKKANNQIKATKNNLNLEDHHGLLILANNNHTALNPSLAMFILGNTFSRYTFSSINSVIYFTANLKSKHPEIPRDLFVWIQSNRDPFNKCPPQLIHRLNKSWVKQFSLITNEPVFEYHGDSGMSIDDITNI